MGLTKTTREKLEDAFFDLSVVDQAGLLDSLNTLHRMKKRQPGETQAVRRAHRFGASTVCSVCGLDGDQAVPGKCPGRPGQPEQQESLLDGLNSGVGPRQGPNGDEG